MIQKRNKGKLGPARGTLYLGYNTNFAIIPSTNNDIDSTEHDKVTYVVCRDFVYLRHFAEVDGWMCASSVSVIDSAMPPVKHYVRGEQKPGLIRMRSTPDNKCEFEWLLNSDFKMSVNSYMLP